MKLFRKSKSKLMYTDIQFNKKIFKSEFKNFIKKLTILYRLSIIYNKIVGMEAPGKYSRYISLKVILILKKKVFPISFKVLMIDLVF